MATIAARLKKAAEDHQAGRLAKARGQYEAILQIDPRQADALHLLGLIHHQSDNPRMAIELIEKALVLSPGVAAFHCNLGAAHQETGDLAKASSCFRRAIELNPNYFQAHFNQGNVGRLTKDWQAAEASYQRCVELNAAHAPSHCFLGITQQQLGNSDEAQHRLEQSIKLSPDSAIAHRHLALSHRLSGQFESALASLQQSLQLDPNDADTYHELGVVHRQLRNDQASVDAFRRTVILDPNMLLAKGNLGFALERMNQLEEAREVAEQGLAISPSNLACGIVLAKCERREGNFHGARLRLEELSLEEADDHTKQTIAFELGLILDRLKEPDEAFGHFTRANQLAARVSREEIPNAAAAVAEIDALADLFRDKTPQTWTYLPAAADTEPPVFLIGFPRSGTTLLEVALDHHPALQTLPEEPAVLTTKREMFSFPDGYPRSIACLTPAQAARLRGVYFQAVDAYLIRQPGTRLVDKMPLNTIALGLILRLFPQAKIIMAVRHPCDSCLSCFMQDFRLNGAMANFLDLEQAAMFYNRVMTLWQLYLRVSPHPFHLVRYEDLVDDFPGEMRRLIKFIDVPWDDSVLRYQEQARGRTKIHTPSYHQVTEPIYRQARFRWLRYARQLEPCMANLKPFIDLFGYNGQAPIASLPAAASGIPDPHIPLPDSTLDATPTSASILSSMFSSIDASPIS